MAELRPRALLRFWPEALASALLLVLVLQLATAIVTGNGGTFTYLLDDTYIHLALAKNLALHHVWGNTRYEFTSSSSSPLWILLLAGSFIAGHVDELAPLILNVLCAMAALAVAAHVLRRRGTPPWAIGLLLGALILCTPMPTVILVGMEHSLHILLVVGWVALLEAPLREGTTLSRRRLMALCALAALLTVTRFESLALVFATAAVLFATRRRVPALLLGASALLALGAYSVVSLSHGWHALPNSVLLKSPPRDWHTLSGVVMALGGRAFVTLQKVPHLSTLLVLALVALGWLWWRERRAPLTGAGPLLVVFAATTFAHVQFAQVGWFYRYEAYLMVLGVLALACAAVSESGRALLTGRTRWVAALATLLLLPQFATRAVHAWQNSPRQAKNIYDQQWQMGRFIAASVGDGAVALNDIGTTSFLSDAHVVDLLGLASLDTSKELLAGGFTRESLDTLARGHHVQLAAIYEEHFRAALPKHWRLIGQWRAPEPVIMLGGRVVSFFATDPASEDELRAKFEAFSKHELPADVPYYIARPSNVESSK